MNLQEIRARFPQYNDLSDTDLADRLHQQYYPQLGRNDFFQRIGLPSGVPPETQAPPSPEFSRGQRAAREQLVPGAILPNLDADEPDIIDPLARLAQAATPAGISDSMPAPPRSPIGLPSGVPPADESSFMGDLRFGGHQLLNIGRGLSMLPQVATLARQGRDPMLDELLTEIGRLEAEPASADPAAMARRQAQIDSLRNLAEGWAGTHERYQQSARESIARRLPAMLETEQAAQEIPMNPAAAAIMEDDASWGDIGRAFMSDPYGVIRTFGLRTVLPSAPSLVGAVGGQFIGGPVGAGALAGLLGGGTEVGAALSEEMVAMGMDNTDPGAVEAWAAENPDAFGEMLQRAFARAGIISAVDAASGGLTGAMARGVAGRGFGARSAVTAAGIPIEGGSEATGDVLAALATGDEISRGEIAASFLGGAALGAPQAGGQVAIEAVAEAASRRPADTPRPIQQQVARPRRPEEEPVAQDAEPQQPVGPQGEPVSPVETVAEAASVPPQEAAPAPPPGAASPAPVQEAPAAPPPAGTEPAQGRDEQTFDLNEWQAIPGQDRGEMTGRVFFENTRTGEVLPQAEFERRAAAPAQPPEESPTQPAPTEEAPPPAADQPAPGADQQQAPAPRPLDGEIITPDDEARAQQEAAREAGFEIGQPPAPRAAPWWGAADQPTREAILRNARPETQREFREGMVWDNLSEAARRDLADSYGRLYRDGTIQNAGTIEEPAPRLATQAERPAVSQPSPREMSVRRPLIERLKSRGLRIDPQGQAAQDLRAMGVTPQTAPGLFRRDGVSDLDNLPAAEFPEWDGLIRADERGMYLDLEDVKQAIADEVSGNPRLPEEARARLESQDTRNQIREAAGRVDDFLREYRIPLTPQEREAVIEAVAGRPTEEMIDAAIERVFIQSVEGVTDYVQPDEASLRGAAEGVDFPGRDEGEAARGEAADAGGRAPGREPQEEGPADQALTERTDAGEQALVPGVAPVTDRDRMEAQMERPMRGGQAPADAGLFDTGARAQDDMFGTPPRAAEPAAEPAPAEQEPRRRGMKAQREREAMLDRLAEYFAPGNVVRSYGGGFDRVVSFERGADGDWSVTVEAVERDGDGWRPTRDSRQRTHRTAPEARDLRAGPVFVAPQEQATAAPEPTPPEPAAEAQEDTQSTIVRLGERLARDMARGEFPDTNVRLMRIAAQEFGGTVAEGAFTPKDAYEAMELAINLSITRANERDGSFDPKVGLAEAKRQVAALQAILEGIPTQTRRDTETDAFQQFSTPPTYAFAANWIANLSPGTRVLEPSAGNGGIAVFAKNAGARVDVNELAERRKPNLDALGFERVTDENAEQIGNIWGNDPSRRYDSVVMNPPFSASAGRISKRTSATGAQHIEQALGLLEPGGRLVAIMGHTFQPGNQRVAPFFRRLERDGYTVQANVVVDGSKVYQKYGTGYDSRLLVIDKTPAPAGHEEVGGRVDSVPELMDLLEAVRDGRTRASQAGDADGGMAGREGGQPASDAGRDRGRETGEPERQPVAGDLVGEEPRAGRPGRPDRAAGRAERAEGDREGDPGRRGRGADSGRPGAGRGRGTTDPDGGTVAFELKDVAEGRVGEIEETGAGMAVYRPTRVRIEGAHPHPMQLVESAAMASVNPPRPNYDPHLPEKMVREGKLSEAQLEAVIYAGAAHSEVLSALPGEPQKRKGFFIGDSTGVGKTREIAGIIADNWAQGRKRSILISKDKKLMTGARRDFDNIGMSSVPIADLGAVKADKSIPKGAEGVTFATYSTLGREAKPDQKSRIDQLVDWVGPDFDGVIAFDEAHLAGNVLPVRGKRGITKPSKLALAVVELQNRLPNARVVYASATGATEVSNLAYADRLGLWGPGTPFPNVLSFVTQIEKGGIAAMEVVARDMKQMGVYIARGLSFDGVEYAKVEHALTEPQREMYDTAAEAWQTILTNVSTVIAEHTQGGGRQRSAAMSAFWGAHQRFFNQVLTAMQMPTILRSIEGDMKDGASPVIQIVNTNEAATTRAMAKQSEGDTLDDIDITPREDLIQYLETSFPVQQYEEYEDENGAIRTRPVLDKSGNAVLNASAVRVRDDLIARLASMRLPGNPLDMIIEKFGPENVAEVTGRARRIVTRDGKKVVERRGQSKALAEAQEFQAGKRNVLVFSDAGGTGMDFHADRGAANKGRRSHYILQAGWRADRAVQGFGRTHRTNQVSAPVYKLAGTNLSGHKRFTSSIARRLDQLGALTKGQKDAGGSMFDATDNLENDFADVAVMSLIRDIYQDNVPGWTMADLENEMGLSLVGEKGLNVSDMPPVSQFLNRLLSVKIDRQNDLFDRFVTHMENAVQFAIDSGTFTAGVEQVSHDGATLAETKEAYRDPATGATSEYRMVTITRKVVPVSFEEIDTAFHTKMVYKRDGDTGTVYAFRPASSRTTEDGRVVPTYHRYSVTDRVIIDASDYHRYERTSPEDAKGLWDAQFAAAPKTRDETMHMVTGALLPIWDRLPVSSPKIVRLRLDDGRQLLGRVIPDQELQRSLEALGVEGPNFEFTPEQIQQAVLERGQEVLLSSGHRLVRRRVGGEPRMEVIPPQDSAYRDVMPGGNLERMGFRVEAIQYKRRAFAATGEKGVAPIKALMMGKRIANVFTTKDQAAPPQDAFSVVPAAMAEGATYKAFRAALNRLGLKDVDLRIDPAIEPQGQIAADLLGRIVITIGNTLNPKWTLGHEAVHAYRHMGVIRETEWAVLSEAAEAQWLERYGIAQRYPELTREEQIEEAIAEAFGEAFDARRAPFTMTGKIRDAFRRIANFLKAVRNWSKGLGMQTQADIFDAMARGEFGRRKRRPAGWETQTERLMKQQRRPSGLQRTGGNFYIPDRQIWDSLFHTNGSLFDRLRATRGAVSDQVDRLRVAFQDRFLPVRRAQEVIARELGMPIPEELDAYLAEEMYSGRAGHKLDMISREFTDKVVGIIRDTKGMTVETAGRYLYARHAKERNERIAQINPDMPDGGSGMSDAEAEAILAAIKASPQASSYEEVGKLVDHWREWGLNQRVEMGLMTADQAKRWAASYSAYVPLKGWADTDYSDAQLDVTGIGRGYNVRGDESRRALGRQSEAFNPLVAAITQAQEVAIRSEKNRVGQTLFHLVKDFPSKAMWEVKKAETIRVFNENTGLVEERTRSPITLLQSANEMAVKVDGQEYRIVLHDERLARAIARVGTDNMIPAFQWLSKFSRYFSAINTMLNPVFVVKNFVRDLVTASINIQSRELGGKILRRALRDVPRAMAGAHRGLGGKADTKWSQYFQEFSEAGGKVSFWVMENPQANLRNIERRLSRSAGAKGLALAMVTPSSELNPVLRGIERVNLAVDNAIRLAAFVHARENGYTTQQAASLAKNLTVNFNRRGVFGSWLNAAYTFSNAGFQGTHIMFKAMKAGKVQAIVAGMVLLGFLLDQANAYLSDEDEDGQLIYDKMRPYLHEMNMVFMLGLGADSATSAASVWLPYGYNVFPLAGNLLSRAYRGQVEPQEAMGSLMAAMLSAFSPIAENDLMGTISPTLTDLPLQLSRNQNWLGWNIHPQYDSPLPQSHQAQARTTAISREIAERVNAWTGGTYAESGFIDVYPDDIDYVAGFLTGGMGRTAGQTVDLIRRMFDGREITTADVPLVRELHRTVGDSERWSLYYDWRDRIRAAHGQARTYIAHGDPVPPHLAWMADLYPAQLEAERYRRGTQRVAQDRDRALRLLTGAYVRAWQANTPYSNETIFD